MPIANEALAALKAILPEAAIKTGRFERVAMASNASFYQLLPQCVLVPQTAHDIQKLFHWAKTHRIPLSFRAAGTSLSGQIRAQGALVDLSSHWKLFDIQEQGQRVWFEPGVIGAHLNRALFPYQRKIGPDPASIQSCMMGGILANNASGMCCGVSQNAYHTLDSMHLVLPSGAAYDTALASDHQRFETESSGVAQGLRHLREKVMSSPALLQKIRDKYILKNTTGYGLNALVDYENPLDILSHLMIGSEGTLGFIASATLKTVPNPPFRLTGFLVFESIGQACEAIEPLRRLGASTLELIDGASMQAVAHQTQVVTLKGLAKQHCALLIEFQADTPNFQSLEYELNHWLGDQVLAVPALWTQETSVQAELWKIRKGLFPSVGAVRAKGSTCIIEDVLFPLEHLAQSTLDLQQLFQTHGFTDAIIFGHAKDGNLHFVISQDFNQPQAKEKYDAFMKDVVALVVSRQGALKAEHGTGVNMAPFVVDEWGQEAYGIMCELKSLIDPEGICNPGVIINASTTAHLEHIKTLPLSDIETDQCIECGFCEAVCPSQGLTLTPRQRIALRREYQRLPEFAENTQHIFQYQAMDTCATDGLCAEACPVNIDTGKLIKRLRAEQSSEFEQALALKAAQSFERLEQLLPLALKGTPLLKRMLRTLPVLKSVFPFLGYETWRSAPSLPQLSGHKPELVYFPSCISRNFGYEQQRSTPEMFTALLSQAQIPTVLPEQKGLCCGLAFQSKGYPEAAAWILNRTIESLWYTSKAGVLPIVSDTSPCTYHLQNSSGLLTPDNQVRFAKMRFQDSISFVSETLLPRLDVTPIAQTVALHPVCSVRKMGLTSHLQKIGEQCAAAVLIPESAGCCGFAGDRGVWVPELTAHALRHEKHEVKTGSQACFSSSRTCELGLERALKQPVETYLALVTQAVKENQKLKGK